MTLVYTPALGRAVELRDADDERVWSDTFVGLYHVPPAEIQPARILDVGANIGLVSAHYAATWPDARIVGVEMDAESCAVARGNAPACEFRQHAVAGSLESGWGYYDRSAPADAFAFVPGFPTAARPGSPHVKALTLRETLLRAFGGPADLVKLDVEGAEWGILGTPAWVPLVRGLLVELHARGAPGYDGPPLEGRDGPSPLLGAAAALLDRAGMNAVPVASHPHALWAWRPW